MAERKSDENAAIDKVKRGISEMLSSEEYYTDAEIGRACGISASDVQRLVNEDPDLRALRAQAEQEMVQKVERSALQLAIGGRNEMARQKSQEFILRKLKPDVYGDNADLSRSAKSQKRILLVEKLPVIAVDDNGIPIAKSASPLTPIEADAEMI